MSASEGEKKGGPSTAGVTALTPGPMVQFLDFFQACHAHVDAPLESALRQSLELAQFTEVVQCPCFLPQKQQQVRWALWELLRDAREREVNLTEMEKQLRLYGRIAKTGAKREFLSSSTISFLAMVGGNHNQDATAFAANMKSATYYSGADGIINGGDGVGGSNGHGNAHNNKDRAGVGASCRVWCGMSEAEEDAAIAALRERGCYHKHVPRHVAHCKRRDEFKRSSLSLSSSLLLSSLSSSSFVRSRLRDTLRVAEVGARKAETTRDLPAEAQNHFSNTINIPSVESNDMHDVLGKIEQLTNDCSLCTAQGLIQGCWVSAHLLQLLNTVSIAHLCAAPLLVPSDALSTTPREALCIGYHVAQHLLQLIVGLFLSISVPPSTSQSSSAMQMEDHVHPMSKDEKAHHARVTATIGVLAEHSLEVCVHLLAVLHDMEPENVYVILLHATVLSFCDRNGVFKAKQLLYNFIASSLSSSERGRLEGDCDAYDMWPMLESSFRGNGALNPDSDGAMLLLEQVATGTLFSVFLQLLELREMPSPFAHDQCACKQGMGATQTSSISSAVAACFRARDALETIVQPRLLKFSDAADGAISTRARQLQSFCWLLRGTLCHVLNALSLAPRPAPPPGCRYDAGAPLACVREAVRLSEAAREFAGHPLAPAWAEDALKRFEGAGRHDDDDSPAICTCDRRESRRNGRLCVEAGAGNSGSGPCADSGGGDTDGRARSALSSSGRVTDVSLLSPTAMRMLFMLARTLFRSASADLVSARSCDDDDGVGTNNGGSCHRRSDGGEGGKHDACGPKWPSTNQANTCVSDHGARVSLPATDRGGVKLKKNITAQREEKTRLENLHKMSETQRRTEESSIGFWFRWQDAMVRHGLLSPDVTTSTEPSLLQRYRRTFISFDGDESKATAFVSALATTYPIVWSERALAASHLFPIATSKRRELAALATQERTDEKKEDSNDGGLSLDVVDGRLREAWQLYDAQCVQPALVSTPTAGEILTTPPLKAKGDRRETATPVTTTATATAGTTSPETMRNLGPSLQSKRAPRTQAVSFSTANAMRRKNVVAQLAPLTTTPTALPMTPRLVLKSKQILGKEQKQEPKPKGKE